MEKAVLLARNPDKTPLANGVPWTYKFKTVTGQYVYAVNLMDQEQHVPATHFATSQSPGSCIGTKVLLETNMIDDILFATRVALDPDAKYEQCRVCNFLDNHTVVHSDFQYRVESMEDFLRLIPKLEELEEKKQLELTRFINFNDIDKHYDEYILTISCVICMAVFDCRIGGEREPQGIHICRNRYSFIED